MTIFIIIFIFLISLVTGVLVYLMILYFSPQARMRRNRPKPGYHTPVQAVDEYSRLLSMLGLDDTASEDDIKNAYRQFCRENHPDSIGSNDPDRVRKFMEVKKAYDRIIDFRKSGFNHPRYNPTN